jgi:molybdopterin synthase sulfur carrier subunit
VIVKVRYYAMLSDVAGKREEDIELPEGSTVLDLVHYLIEKFGLRLRNYVYDEEGQLLNYMKFNVNGVNILSLEGFETLLDDDDVVQVIPPIGGG